MWMKVSDKKGYQRVARLVWMFSCFVVLAVTNVAVTNTAMANTVAVLDTRNAVLNTAAAKKAIAKLEKTISGDRARLSQLQQEISALETKFKSKRGNMDATQKQAMQQQAQAKLGEYNQLTQRIQVNMENSQTQLLTTLMPKLKSAVKHIQSSKNIDVVVNKAYVYSVSPAWDITADVTNYMNQH